MTQEQITNYAYAAYFLSKVGISIDKAVNHVSVIFNDWTWTEENYNAVLSLAKQLVNQRRVF